MSQVLLYKLTLWLAAIILAIWGWLLAVIEGYGEGEGSDYATAWLGWPTVGAAIVIAALATAGRFKAATMIACTVVAVNGIVSPLLL